jgi:hypothetical protein
LYSITLLSASDTPAAAAGTAQSYAPIVLFMPVAVVMPALASVAVELAYSLASASCAFVRPLPLLPGDGDVASDVVSDVSLLKESPCCVTTC